MVCFDQIIKYDLQQHFVMLQCTKARCLPMVLALSNKLLFPRCWLVVFQVVHSASQFQHPAGVRKEGEFKIKFPCEKIESHKDGFCLMYTVQRLDAIDGSSWWLVCGW